MGFLLITLRILIKYVVKFKNVDFPVTSIILLIIPFITGYNHLHNIFSSSNKKWAFGDYFWCPICIAFWVFRLLPVKLIQTLTWRQILYLRFQWINESVSDRLTNVSPLWNWEKRNIQRSLPCSLRVQQNSPLTKGEGKPWTEVII